MAAPERCLRCRMATEHLLHPANVDGHEGFLCCRCAARATGKLLEIVAELRVTAKKLREAVEGVERAID